MPSVGAVKYVLQNNTFHGHTLTMCADVRQPLGADSLGLFPERYAIENGPRKATQSKIIIDVYAVIKSRTAFITSFKSFARVTASSESPLSHSRRFFLTQLFRPSSVRCPVAAGTPWLGRGTLALSAPQIQVG